MRVLPIHLQIFPRNVSIIAAGCAVIKQFWHSIASTLGFLLLITNINAFICSENLYAQSGSWLPTSGGIERLELKSTSYLFFTNHVVFYRAPLSQYRLGVVRAEEYGSKRQKVRVLAKNSRALLGINANFFDENGEPLGLVVARGITHHKIQRGGDTLTGVLEVTHSGPAIINRSDFAPRSVSEAIQAGPRLLDGGKIIPGLKDTAKHSRRSGVCLDASNRVIFYASSAGYFGLSMEQLVDLLGSQVVGCVDALNLDGGSSSQFFVSSSIAGLDPEQSDLWIEGNDDVPVMLGLFVKE